MKRIIKPPLSPKLAEFIGIMAGDGYMNHYTYQHKYLLEIAGDKRLDKDYLTKYVYDMIVDLFDIEPTVYVRKKQNTMYLRVISKRLVQHMAHLDFPYGKKGQIQIPEWIKSNPLYMNSFVRGVADTDMCLYYRNGTYPIVSYTTISLPLITSIFTYLETRLSLSRYYREESWDKRTEKTYVRYQMKIRGHKNLSIWSNWIGFRNKRHKKVGPEESSLNVRKLRYPKNGT